MQNFHVKPFKLMAGIKGKKVQDFTTRDMCKITRILLMLRKTLGSFSIKRLSFDSVVDVHVSGSIIICILNRNNLQPQEKGFMSRHDARKQTLFTQKVKHIIPTDLWTNGIRFYFERANWSVMD